MHSLVSISVYFSLDKLLTSSCGSLTLNIPFYELVEKTRRNQGKQILEEWNVLCLLQCYTLGTKHRPCGHSCVVLVWPHEQISEDNHLYSNQTARTNMI